MGIKFSEVKENSPIVLNISANDKHMDLGAVVKKHLGQNMSLITLNYDGSKRLTFNNVQIDVLHCPEDAVPVIWHKAKIINHKDSYILQVTTEGTKSNRRNSFRVSVATMGWLNVATLKPRQIMVKDVSMTGFAITDRKKELNLAMGTRLSLSFDDITFHINLEGKVVRIEEHEDYIIYGMVILNVCNDLPLYIGAKQRKSRK